jgi:hypothetical protein
VYNKALRLLPTNINFPFSEISLTPYVPVPDTNGEEWDRLELASALDALVELAIHGEYNGLDAGKRTKESLELRSAAAAVFEVGPFHIRYGNSLPLTSFISRTSSVKTKSARQLFRRCFRWRILVSVASRAV